MIHFHTQDRRNAHHKIRSPVKTNMVKHFLMVLCIIFEAMIMCVLYVENTLHDFHQNLMPSDICASFCIVLRANQLSLDAEQDHTCVLHCLRC